MKEEPGGSPDKLERLSAEQREMLESIDDEDLREHTGLCMLLSEAFQEMDEKLYKNVCEMASAENTLDADELVAAHLSAPDDSELRNVLINYLLDKSGPQEVVDRLRDIERFLSKNA